MKLPTLEKPSGYTLIELMVVISILGLVLGLGIAGWNRYQQQETLRSETLKAVTWLRAVQSKATQGEKPSTDCESLNRYLITQTGNGLQAVPYCLDSGGSESGLSDDSQSVELEDLVSLDLSSNFSFYTNSRTIGDSVTIDITYTATGASTTITISNSGKISWQSN